MVSGEIPLHCHLVVLRDVDVIAGAHRSGIYVCDVRQVPARSESVVDDLPHVLGLLVIWIRTQYA